MLLKLIFFKAFLSLLAENFAMLNTYSNVTESRIKSLEKRSLIFEGGGTIKLSIGVSAPVFLDDPISWRSLVHSFSLQGGQYTIPTTPIYPWDKWEDTFARDLKEMKEKFDSYGHWRQDDSRLFVYILLEGLFNNYGKTKYGKICLLRCICENAQIGEHIGIFAEVLDIILTPGNEDIDEDYKIALRAGKAGADCWSLYYKCPRKANFLEQFLYEF